MAGPTTDCHRIYGLDGLMRLQESFCVGIPLITGENIPGPFLSSTICQRQRYTAGGANSARNTSKSKRNPGISDLLPDVRSSQTMKISVGTAEIRTNSQRSAFPLRRTAPDGLVLCFFMDIAPQRSFSNRKTHTRRRGLVRFCISD